MVNIVKRAERAAHEQERRDDMRSTVCISRAIVGLFFVFQPLKLIHLVEQPVGRAVSQLFFVSHFYLRLGWLLLTNGRQDFFGVPPTRRGKMKKRAVSSVILVGCIAASQHVGWAREDLPTVRRALPSGLALGVVVARTVTSLFDYVTRCVAFAHLPGDTSERVLSSDPHTLRREIRERAYIVFAKRAIFKPEHADIFIDVHEKLNEHLHTEETRALNEAAREARTAVERAIRLKSVLQEEARKKRANKRGLQVCTRQQNGFVGDSSPA